eukprot:gene17126-35448_t
MAQSASPKQPLGATVTAKMKIESCTTPKYRDLSQPGDDVLVVLPQCLYAVQGESPGRLAARQAALAMVRYASEPDHVLAPAQELMAAMNRSIAHGLQAAGAGSVRAGTTVVMVTHSPSHAAQASRTLNLLDGRIMVDALRAERGYSAVTILGLALGFAACFLLMAYVRFSFGYDSHVPHADRVYVAKNRINLLEHGGWFDNTPINLLAVAEGSPLVEAAAVALTGSATLRQDGTLRSLDFVLVGPAMPK